MRAPARQQPHYLFIKYRSLTTDHLARQPNLSHQPTLSPSTPTTPPIPKSPARHPRLDLACPPARPPAWGAAPPSHCRLTHQAPGKQMLLLVIYQILIHNSNKSPIAHHRRPGIAQLPGCRHSYLRIARGPGPEPA